MCYLISYSKRICSNQFGVRRRKSTAISGFRCLHNFDSSKACWSTNGKLPSYCKKSGNKINFQVETFDPTKYLPPLERKIQNLSTYELKVEVPINAAKNLTASVSLTFFQSNNFSILCINNPICMREKGFMCISTGIFFSKTTLRFRSFLILAMCETFAVWLFIPKEALYKVVALRPSSYIVKITFWTESQ